MAKLSKEQTARVSAWVAEGATLAQVQARLVDEMDVHMTYMDVRFLVDDLNLSLVEKEEPKAAEAPAEDSAGSPAQDAPEATPAAPQSGVSISVDTVVRPGAVVSGTATFSDGEVGEWYLDQMGQLGFNPRTPGYRPSQADVADFQVKLDAALRQAGY
ncbi:MAG: hypothetical protein RJA37_1163 [Verrucomicrobiota bacterium]|jgi:hypothetical protein